VIEFVSYKPVILVLFAAAVKSEPFARLPNHFARMVRLRCEAQLTGPIFCTKRSVSVTLRRTFVRSRRRGCGDVGNAQRFPYLHAPLAR
jgi:hypothetical protein